VLKRQASPSTSLTSRKAARSPLTLPLRGAGGEPVSFAFTINSHGLPSLPPGHVDEATPAYDFTVALDGAIATLHFTQRDGLLIIASDRRLSAGDERRVRAMATRMFRLEDNLASFYAMIEGDPDLEWARAGAGRMLASPTVFEDVIRTICTTNCAWSATTRMITKLVELGGGAFPEPALLAGTRESWFADVARMGYRGPYVRAIAANVAKAALNLEILLPEHGLGEEEVELRLLALPGIGPYAAAHVMQLLGYHHQLILDSWTRPTFLELSKMKRAKDSTIRRRFARYGRFAGLAFWLYLTRRWHLQSKETLS
jgi:3-methyladenine DNA glycosylase/8-oxoguanine DNA glycosylase